MPPPKKPSLEDVLNAINDLSAGMGAELAAARAEVVALTAEVVALKELVKSKPTVLPEMAIAAVIQAVPMPAELATMHPLAKHEVDLIKDNKKIDAIKCYRARIQVQFNTYVGLKEAKDLICYVADHMNDHKPVFDPANPVPMTEDQKNLVKQGKKIDAIKDYRTYVGSVCAGMCGLKEAKDVIDVYDASLSTGDMLVLLPSESAMLHYDETMGVFGKIEAIAAYRKRTGLGLKPAVAALDKYIASKGWVEPLKDPPLFTGAHLGTEVA